MKVGVVILNYNVSDAVINLLGQINSYQCVDKIVVVDNASSEEEQKKLVREFNTNVNEKIFFIQSEINGGYAKGNNIGLRYLVEKCECDICFVCNPDIYISELDMQKVITAFITHKEYGVLTCSREYSDGEKIRQYWNLADYKTLLLTCFSLYRKLEKKKNIYVVPTVQAVITIGVAPGAFWGVRSDLLVSVNYMDEETFLYFEESCFAKKIQRYQMMEGLVTGACYKIFKEKASTLAVRKNGRGFQYIMESKNFYASKYICNTRWKYIIWRICKKLGEFEQNMITIIRR